MKTMIIAAALVAGPGGIEKIVCYGRQRGINGTPTLIFADGLRVGGAIPYDELKRLLDGAR